MRLVEQHATDLVDADTLSVNYREKMAEEKSSDAAVMGNRVAMSERNGDHARDEDSIDKLLYGPGIVSRLKSKFMSMALRDEQTTGVRRSASVENILDDVDSEAEKQPIDPRSEHTNRTGDNARDALCPAYQQQRDGLRTNSFRRSASVETLIQNDTKRNARAVHLPANQLSVIRSGARDAIGNIRNNLMKPISKRAIVIVETKKAVGEESKIVTPRQQKLRVQNVESGGELPPPDLVKQILKMFEEGSPVSSTTRFPGGAAGDASTKALTHRNVTVPKLILSENQNSTSSGSKSLSPKQIPTEIRRNVGNNPTSTLTSPTTVNGGIPPLSCFVLPSHSPTAAPSVRASQTTVSSPKTETRKLPARLPYRQSLKTTGSRFSGMANGLPDDGSSSDEDDAGETTKNVSLSALENIRNDGTSMRFNFGSNVTASETSKSHLPGAKSGLQSRATVPPSPIVREPPSTQSSSGQSKVVATGPPSSIVREPPSTPSSSGQSKSVATGPPSSIVREPPSTPASPSPDSDLPDLLQSQQKQVVATVPIRAKVSSSSAPTIPPRNELVEENVNGEKWIEPSVNRKNSAKASSEPAKDRVKDSVETVLPIATSGRKESKSPGLYDVAPWHQDQNSTLITFVGSGKPIPSHIKNYNRNPAPKPASAKSGESVIILNNPGAITESSTDDVDEYSVGVSGPPSPCNVHFEGDNVLINGRSNIRKHPRQAKLRITFNDAATTTYEYPSEASFLNEVASPPVATSSSNGAAPTMPLPPSPSGSTPGVPFGGSSLASYTPSKVHLGGEDFQLGVTRSTPHTGRPVLGPEPIPEPEAVEEDYLKPAEDSETVAWSAETAADLLF